VEWLACTAVLLLGACDVVWSVDHVSGGAAAGSGGTDAPNTISCEQDKHDEDGDLFPDACDRCPGIADDQADADGDGVGDACDPSGIEKNDLVLWLSFADGPQSWTAVNGNWPFDGENLVYESVSLPSNAYVVYNGVVPDPPYVVDYAYTLDSIDTVGSLFQIVLDANASGNGVNCGHSRQVGPLRDVVRVTAPTTAGAETAIMTVTPGTYRVVASYDRNGDVRCSLTGPGTGGAAKITLSAPPTAGTLAFRSLQIGAKVKYLAIYKAH
jgi:hypothetical protein